MADVLSPSLFLSNYSKSPNPPQSKLFELAPLSDKPVPFQPHERPSMASGISRQGYTKNGDGPDLTMNQPTLQRYRRDREYYIDGGDIVFLVSSFTYSCNFESSSCLPCHVETGRERTFPRA